MCGCERHFTNGAKCTCYCSHAPLYRRAWLRVRRLGKRR